MAMIDPNGIMPLNFFKYKGVYTGQHNGMRYMLIERTCSVPADIFELTEDGRLAAVEWIRQQYESRLDYWEEAPSIKDAVPIVHE